MLWVAACNVQCTCYTEHDDVVCLARMQKLLSPCISSAAWVCMVWYVWYTVCMVGWSWLCCEILLLLNMVDMDRWNTGVTKLSTLVHLVHMNRLSACREFCGVHCWQCEWHKM